MRTFTELLTLLSVEESKLHVDSTQWRANEASKVHGIETRYPDFRHYSYTKQNWVFKQTKRANSNVPAQMNSSIKIMEIGEATMTLPCLVTRQNKQLEPQGMQTRQACRHVRRANIYRNKIERYEYRNTFHYTTKAKRRLQNYGILQETQVYICFAL